MGADDHLGSTRLLSGYSGYPIATYTYGPYGEEFNPQTTVNHYKFTGKERDSESGLDNFGARYDSSQYGRFMTPDQPGMDQFQEDPQSWNLYTYGRNNPLVFIDPTGQYVCGDKVDEKQCSNFQDSLDKAQAAANVLKDKYGANSDKYLSAQRGIDAYGKPGVNNGVTIQVGATGNRDVGLEVGSAPKTADNPIGQNITLTFKSPAAFNDVGLAAHEGVHVADASDWVKSGFSSSMNPRLYNSESRALNVQAGIYEGMGASMSSVQMGGATYPLGSPAWPQPVTTYFINRILAVPTSRGGVYGVTPQSQALSFNRR